MIRSVTVGVPIGISSQARIATDVKRLLGKAGKVLGSAGLLPRTIRYTLPPVGAEGETEGHIHSMLRWVDGLAAETDVRWYCLPIDFVTEGPRRERLGVSLDVIGRFPRLFLNLMVADETKLSIGAINDVSLLIGRIAKKTNNGFDNFRVGASCGCPANTPFFPFSRHGGGDVGFSFALETIDLALEVAKQCGPKPSIDGFRDLLVDRLSSRLGEIHELGARIAGESGCEYRGLDASFAPFPNGHSSVAGLVEYLLGAPIGSHGSVFITGILTDVIRASLIRSGALAVGFNGVMYSLLEDNALASANSRRCIGMDGLVALSAMCGCGVDMVPVPGLSFPEELSAVMLDIAAMSISLKKPLGVRLLPIPGKSPNEFTQFNLDFLCDSRVMGLTANDRSLASGTHAMGMLAPSRLSMASPGTSTQGKQTHD